MNISSTDFVRPPALVELGCLPFANTNSQTSTILFLELVVLFFPSTRLCPCAQLAGPLPP